MRRISKVVALSGVVVLSLIAVLSFILTGCSGSSVPSFPPQLSTSTATPVAPGPVLSPTPPTARINATQGPQTSIVITSPSGADGFTVTAASIDMGGFATSDVTTVTWSTNTGGSGTATGTTAWTAAGVPLSTGDNLFTVTGLNQTGQTVSQTTDIVNNPTLAETSPLTASTNTLFVNEPLAVTFTISLPNTKTLDKNSVQVVQVDQSFNVIGTLGPMVDQAGNFTFTGQFTISSATAGTLFYRVQATAAGSPFLSEVVPIQVTTHISDAEFSTVQSVFTQVLQAYNSNLAKGGTLDSAQQAALAFLASDTADVLSFGPSTADSTGSNGFGISIIFQSQLLGQIMLNPPGTRGGPGAATSANGVLDPLLSLGSWLESGSSSHPTESAVRKNLPNGNVQPDSLTGIGMDGFNFSADPIDCVNRLNNAPCPYTATETTLTFSQCKSLNQFGVVYIATHGDTFAPFNGPFPAAITLSSVNFGIFRKTGLGALCGFMTPDVILKSNLKTFEGDLRAGRIAFEGTPLKADGSSTPPGTFNIFPFILPSFITTYDQGFKSSLVSLASCRSAFNPSLANAFLGAGARVFTGYTNYVTSTLCISNEKQFYGKLLGADSKTNPATVADASRAVNPITDAPGAIANQLLSATFLIFPTSPQNLQLENCSDKTLVYVAEEGSTNAKSGVAIIDPETRQVLATAVPGAVPFDVSFLTASNACFSANDKSIGRFDAFTGLTSGAITIQGPNSFARVFGDQIDNLVWATTFNGTINSPDQLLWFDPATNNGPNKVTTTFTPFGITMDTKDKLICCGSGMTQGSSFVAGLTVVDPKSKTEFGGSPFTNSSIKNAGDVTYDSVDNRIFYVSNPGNTQPGNVIVFQAPGFNVVSTITVGQEPIRIAYSAKLNQIYVSCFNSNTVSVINAGSMSVTNTINTNDPVGVDVDDLHGLLFVANQAESTVSVFDSSSGSSIATITLPTTAGSLSGVTVGKFSQ